MIRRVVALPCEDGWIMATLDGPAEAVRGWVMVTGGSQTRVGPHRLYERLAVALASAGEAVIRFDRRGVGDSPGEDRGYAASSPEIATAINALNEHFPNLTELCGFGLCDGATALALQGGIGRLVLANPWVVEPQDDLPPAAAIRGHYKQKLADPKAWIRLLSGGVNFRKLARGLARSARPESDDLAARVAKGIPADTLVILATQDGTAQAFEDAWRRLPGAPPVRTARIATASHSFASPDAFAQLAALLTRPR